MIIKNDKGEFEIQKEEEIKFNPCYWIEGTCIDYEFKKCDSCPLFNENNLSEKETLKILQKWQKERLKK